LRRVTKALFKSVAGMILVLLVLVGSARGKDASPGARLALHYRLVLARPTAHLVEVEIDVKGATDPEMDFAMPAWSPGRYAIYDFAKNVQEFTALDAQRRALPSEKIDKQTWRVDARAAAGEVHVHYKVFANDLNGSFSQFDSTHANLNGASIYLYVAGHKSDPISVSVEAPTGWKVISGYSLSTDEKNFEAASYDRLIDTPMEISPECSIKTFDESGKTFRIAVHSYASEPGKINRLTDDLKKVVRSEMRMMPAPDFDHYTFIFHFDPDVASGDGMEHLNSTQIILSSDPTESGVQVALELAAHEFFHVWNVKRLRPAALGPFDYTKENHTRSLWLAEGTTSYYAYVHLLRSGNWTRDQFLNRLANEIRELERDPGRKLMSAEDSSFNAWFYDRAPQMQETNFANTTISYYNKGALLGMLLDLEIRSRTNGRKSLDDVMRFLYTRFYDAPPATDYGPGHGYEEADVLDAVNQISSSDFGAFFEKYVRGTDPLPYAEALALAGMALRVEADPGAPPSLGIMEDPEDRGVRIRAVFPGEAADRAGLSRDDLLISADDLSLATESLAARLGIYSPGASVPFTVERHGRRQIITVTLDPPPRNRFSIVEAASATSEQRKIRKGWLD
jgi:predicted metalloprotease with PDZ domain